jgi:hypothetical protein
MNDEHRSDPYDHTGDPDRREREGAPDPSQDEWSAWLPQLDPTTDRTPPPDEAVPPAPPPVPPRPQPRPQPSRPQPALPHLPPPTPARRGPAGSTWSYPPAPSISSYNRPPNNHLVAAILVTIFCFWPFGIVAIIKAASVNSLWMKGDAARAHRAARSARAWALAAFITSVALVVAAILFAGMISLVASR